MTSATKAIHTADAANPNQLIKKVTKVVALGVVLNPLNSSMISVALFDIQSSFGIQIATVTWLITCFYLAATVGQPLMGKLADLFGARLIFSLGVGLVILSSILSIWTASFGWLLFCRVLQAFGTTTAYPAGLAIIRSLSQGMEKNNSSASSLGLISITANVMAALGPTIGGLLVAYISWKAIFWINIPIAVIVLLLTWIWIPKDKKNPTIKRIGILKIVDLPGIIMFSSMLISLTLFLSYLKNGFQWWLLILSVLSAIILVLREIKISKPFLDVKMLVSNIRLVSVFAQFAGLNIVFYALFFGLPMWLGQVKGYDPQIAGFIMLPFAGLGVLTTPIAVRMIQRSSHRPVIIIGNAVLVIGTLLLLMLGSKTPVILILIVAAIIGIPNGLNNLGLSTAMYSYAKPEETGVASGLFQTCRSVGSILSTSLLGLTFSGSVTTSGLHTIAIIAATISAGLLVISLSRKLT
ncbi:MFS transporter [Paenibacillus donghaensis]|uniref:MFS transporter n=1 Tax=Paenibacillus donghaensis TaxID=414771 RepID=UPI001883B24A|nr:MFS transporter [Paenibacillus donghaensis]MBE9916268.1 MFS transporter [Paenibacillus donghaensis]